MRAGNTYRRTVPVGGIGVGEWHKVIESMTTHRNNAHTTKMDRGIYLHLRDSNTMRGTV